MRNFFYRVRLSWKVFLRAKGKQKHILQSSLVSHDKSIDDWGCDDAQFMAWLSNNMEPQISSNVMFKKTAKKIWDVLAMMYSSYKNLVWIFELFSKILSLLQGDVSNWVLFYFCGLFEDLNLYQLISLNAFSQGKQSEEFRVAKFLLGLRTKYENVCLCSLGL